MRANLLLLTAVVLLAIGADGCRKTPGSKLESAPLDHAFGNDTALAVEPSATESGPGDDAVQRQVTSLRREMRAHDYATAAAQLRQLQTASNLSGEQLRALHEQMVIIQQRLAERAAKGDSEAKRAWKEFQDSLTK